jgi:hypothetical protein
MNPSTSSSAAERRLSATGLCLLAISLPLGLTLEALHAWKVPVYLDNALRRELWTLAHAHGNLLGLLCLVMALLGPRLRLGDRQHRFASLTATGSLLMPVGFLLGGIGNREGDPSWGIVLVPGGGVLLLVALVMAGLAALRSDGQVSQ